jgi:uncharacterized protein (TIGR02145 family)
MTIRILLFTMLPILCIAQVSPKEDILSNNNPSIERENLATKHNAQYNLEEIKVRWKKAALENCPGVPCVTFTCGTSTVSDFDGNAYNTVAIGAQCWTKENLKVTKYNDGTLIGDSTNSTWGTAGAALIGARTEYVSPYIPSSGYVGTYGYLYNWYAATDPRKLCPTGWHVPTDTEWTTMIQQLDNTASTSTIIESPTVGGKMKSTSSLWLANMGADNSSDFSALPGGFRAFNYFFAIKNSTFFWSATAYDDYNAWNRELFREDARVERKHNNGTKSTGASIRCLKD